MSEALETLQTELKARGQKEGGDMWFGKPDRWYEKAHWRCTNDHVSGHYIKSEEHGDLCPACMKPVLLTFPEDKDGPLGDGK